MILLFGVAFIVMAAPNKAFDHYQGYLLIWLGLLGAWTIDVVASPLLPRWQRSLVCLATGCATVLLAAAAHREVTSSAELASAKSRLDLIVPEVRNALASRPAHPTLQVFDPIYSDHGISDSLIMALTGAAPPNPLFWTVFYAERFTSALPPALQDQWGLLARNPPDIVLLIDVEDSRSSNYVGHNFAPSVRQFLDSHAYRARTIADNIVMAESPVARPE
jgi:hypothetical protein